MEYKQIDDCFFLRIDKDEDVIEALRFFCVKHKVKLGVVSGIGSFKKAIIGYFDPFTKEYHTKDLEGIFEVINLSGNISTKADEPYLHLHVTLSDVNYNAIGGHLNYGQVSATCEICIQKVSGVIERVFNHEVGLNLFKF